MGYLLKEVFFWMIYKLIIFLFILMLLVGFYSILAEYERYKEDVEGRAELFERIEENKTKLKFIEKEIKEETQKKLHLITQVIRDALGRNMRLIDPVALDDPLCRTHTRFQIPYLLSLDNPTLQGMNIVIRPQVYVSLRS